MTTFTQCLLVSPRLRNVRTRVTCSPLACLTSNENIARWSISFIVRPRIRSCNMQNTRLSSTVQNIRLAEVCSYSKFEYQTTFEYLLAIWPIKLDHTRDRVMQSTTKSYVSLILIIVLPMASWKRGTGYQSNRVRSPTILLNDGRRLRTGLHRSRVYLLRMSIRTLRANSSVETCTVLFFHVHVNIDRTVISSSC